MTARLRRGIAAVLVIAVVVWFGVILHGLTKRITNAEDDADDNAATASTALTAADRLARQVERLGGTPVVEPSNLPSLSPQAAKGDPGADGQTGPAGATGSPGPGPTRPEIAAAVAAYCGVKARCVGPAGATGGTGKDGAQGDTGATGATGTQGPAGATGPQGADGATGPAGYPASFTFTYLGATYTCADPDGDHAYSCEAP